MTPPRERRGYAVCGGGTGGHIFPALAVAAELQRQAPGEPVIYLGKTAGMEQELAQRAGLPFHGLPAAGLARSFSPRNLLVVWKTLRGFARARRVLKTAGVRAVLGTGGFVCGPVVLAAASLRIPAVIHESNVVPGLTNKLLARWAAVVAVGQEQSRAFFPAGKTAVTGFPLRPRLTEPTREQGCAVFGLDAQRPVLFVFPGSLAARRVNRSVAEALPQLCRRRPEWQVLWMTGKADYSFVQRVVAQFNLPVVIREFIFEVPEAYAASDVVLARAGAGTLAELSATGKPSLLVPYPHATNNHQTHNAQALAGAGAAEIVADADLDGDRLLTALLGVFSRLESLRQNAALVRDAYPRQAAAALARILIGLGTVKS